VYDGQTGAEVIGNLILLHFVDGLRGDDDLTANGVIKEPGAPALTNEAPTDISLSNSLVPENLPSGTLVGTFGTTDPDAGDTFTYALVSGTGGDNNGSFTIDGGSLKTAASFDYEGKSSYSIRVRSTDQGGLWTEKEFIVTVTDVNEAPTDIALSNSTVAENQPSGTVVGTLSGTDPDVGQSATLDFTLVDGFGDNGRFSIDPVTKQLKTAAAFDYEAKNSYSIRIRATDSGSPALSYDEPFTITVTNVNEQPILTTVSTLIGATKDFQYTVTYSMLAGAANGADPDGQIVGFRIEAISTGTKKLTKGGVDVVPGNPEAILWPGESWVWTPAKGKTGILDAFTIKAWDGSLASATVVQVKIQVDLLPDLQPTAVDSTIWQSAEPGTQADWTVTVKNNGPGPQWAPWQVQWYLSTDNKYQASDILVGSATYSDDLAKGATVTKTITAAVPSIPKAGQYYVIARLVNTGPDSKASNDTKASTDKDWFGSVDPDSYEDQDQEENDSRESATDLGYVAGTKAYTGLTIHQSGNEDWYQFTTCRQGTTKVQIDFTNTEGDLALALFDQDGTQLAPTSDKTGNSEKVSINNLPEGQYYIKVWSSHGDVSRNYKLTIIAPSGPDLQITKVDSNVWQSAQIDDDIAWTATIKNNGPGNQRAPWQLEWYLSTDNKLGSTDTLIGSQVYDDDIEAKGTIDKTFDAKVPAIPAGQYYVIAKVTTTGPETNTKNNTKASTDKDWFGSVDPDSYEDNDSMDAAWDLGSSKVTLDNLTIDDGQDEDWYSFELTRPGTSSNKVQIDFTNAEGDLDIELYDSEGNLLKGAYTAANSHQISLSKLAAGKYYVRILAHQQDGYLPDLCRKYKLTLIL